MALSRLRLILLGVLLLPGTMSQGVERTFFSSQESVEYKLVGLIDASRRSIDMALFEFRSPALKQALLEAEKRGVALRLVLDASHPMENFPGGRVRWLGGKTSGGRGVMHNKFALFDQGRVVTGSYNWTPGAEHSNYENALLTDDAETVKAYAGEFETLWKRAAEGPGPVSPPHVRSGFFSHGKPRASPRRKQPKTSKIRIPKTPVKKKHKR